MENILICILCACLVGCNINYRTIPEPWDGKDVLQLPGDPIIRFSRGVAAKNIAISFIICLLLVLVVVLFH